MAFRDHLINSWRQPNALTLLLWPLSLLYKTFFVLNRRLYQLGIKRRYRAPVPVIVVGNITVGGTGKTPLVIFLVEALREHGFKPAVISRGYSGKAPEYPLEVTEQTPVAYCGDEPTLIAKRTGVPMCVGPSRQSSIELLLKKHSIDVIVSDDGLQHFALQRDIEMCVVDDASPLTNTNLLPAGPFREAKSRLLNVDFVIHHGGDSGICMQLEASNPRPVIQKLENEIKLDTRQKVHAVAGIGNPQRFFDTCVSIGLTIEKHSFPDHHLFTPADIDFGDSQVIMTEKDAVKSLGFADQRHWYIPVNAKLTDGFTDRLIETLKDITL